MKKLACSDQRSTMNRFFSTHKCSWNFEYEWVNSIVIHLFWFIRTQLIWYQTHNNRNMFDSYGYLFRFVIILKNDSSNHKWLNAILINDSSDSNHSSIFTVLIVAAFTKKEERQRQQEKQTHTILVSIVLFVCESHIFCDSFKFQLWRVEINNIICIVNYEYEEYFKV